MDHHIVLAKKVVKDLNSSSPISDEGKGSLGTILNPCGENLEYTNKRYPDGTLSQSALIHLRLFQTIFAPWQNSQLLENSSNLWSLFLICPPCFATLFVMVASKDNSEPTDTEWNEIVTFFNANPQSTYPAWREAITGRFYISVMKFSAADKILTSNEKAVESWRIVGDGHVLMHNTPTLWDQGTLAVGQFQTDVATANANVGQELVTFRITQAAAGQLTVSCFFTLPSGTITNLWAPVNIATTATGSVLATLGTGVVQQFNVDLDDETPFARYRGTQIAINITYNTVLSTLTIANPATPTVPVVFTGLSGISVGFNASKFGSISGPYVSDQNISTQVNDITQWSLPSLSSADVVQADPKFSAELMKKHGGYYAVRRFFEPVLSMTDASVTLIKLNYKEKETSSADVLFGGIQNDMLDKNAAAIIGVIKGISYAANPAVKAERFIEAMGGPGSSIAAFISDCPPKDEDAIDIFREVQTVGPHSYIPDANALGFLASMITSIVEYLPLALRGARSASLAIAKAVDWAETNLFSTTPKV